MSVELAERRNYPIYLVLDVSASMRRRQGNGRSPQDAFTTLIPDLILSLSDAPALATSVWMSVIAFSDKAELLSPMTSLAEPANVREPADGVETDYVAALRFLAERMERDKHTMQQHGSARAYRTTIARPLVFFITDGAPFAEERYQRPEEWMPYRDRLVCAPAEARIAAIGLVGAHPKTLWALSTGSRVGERNAFIALPDANAESLARSIINVIERSIKLSVRTGDLIIEQPDGMRRIDG